MGEVQMALRAWAAEIERLKAELRVKTGHYEMEYQLSRKYKADADDARAARPILRGILGFDHGIPLEEMAKRIAQIYAGDLIAMDALRDARNGANKQLREAEAAWKKERDYLSGQRQTGREEIERLRELLSETLVDCKMARDEDMAWLDPAIERLEAEKAKGL